MSIGLKTKMAIIVFISVFVLVTLAFYFATPCSVSGGMPSPDGITQKRNECTCLGLEYLKREEQIPDKPSTYMCVGIVIDTENN